MVTRQMRNMLRSTKAAGVLFSIAIAFNAFAATTINPVNRFAYGANIGWIDWRGDVANGAVIGEFVCSGYIYAANVGWIHLGDGAPANGVRYLNLSGDDFGDRKSTRLNSSH